MKKILAILGVIGAAILGFFLKDKIDIKKLLDDQDEELKSSDEKLQKAKDELDGAKDAVNEKNVEVDDLDEIEVDKYWKDKLQ